MLVRVTVAVRVAGCHRGHREHEDQEARDADRGHVEPAGAARVDERETAADDRDRGKCGGEQVLEADLLDAAEHAAETDGPGERPHHDAHRVHRQAREHHEPVGAGDDEPGPADLRHRAHGKQPGQRRVVAVVPGRSRVDQPRGGRRHGGGGEGRRERAGGRRHRAILARRHEPRIDAV